jgi:hypothetical protein
VCFCGVDLCLIYFMFMEKFWEDFWRISSVFGNRDEGLRGGIIRGCGVHNLHLVWRSLRLGSLDDERLDDAGYYRRFPGIP